ncbi:ASB_HP2_G0031400.mRNA.1.CDS.1 [Saccharomyces cerevisiae]|nr:ASB_HP2_G0031400.mRNA.1.CDS.1 [Saccharomyces cerevisiae]CAI6609154.1 ASB_HP2_G0031400.mRNA.1.CDS.1 [Saccharomyces cerevisiae]
MGGSTDRVLSFLPLALILNWSLNSKAFYWNGILGYGSLDFDNTSTRNCKGDLLSLSLLL